MAPKTHEHEIMVGGWTFHARTRYSRSMGAWIAFAKLGGQWKSVIGAHANQAAAIAAAKMKIELSLCGEDRICTPADIVKARREMVKSK